MPLIVSLGRTLSQSEWEHSPAPPPHRYYAYDVNPVILELSWSVNVSQYTVHSAAEMQKR